MKITKRQLRRIIKEEKQVLPEPTKPVEVVEEGGVLTISMESATEVEVIIAHTFGVIDDLILAIEDGGYPRNSRQVVIDPRLEKMKNELETAVDSLYNAQMQVNHLMSGTGG